MSAPGTASVGRWPLAAALGLLALGLLAFAALGRGRPADDADPFAKCRRGAAREPQAYTSYLCFEDAAHQADERAAAVAELEQREAVSPWATLVLGHMALASSNLERAAGLYRRAASRFDWSAELRGSVLARTNLWRIYSNLGRQADATDQVERTLASAQSATDPELQIRVRLLEASHLLYTVSGDLRRVDRLLRETEARLPQVHVSGLGEQMLELRADLFRTLGRQDRALRTVEQLFALRASQGPSRLLARDAVTILQATIDLAQGPDARPHAIARAEQALELSQKVGQEVMEARASLLLGVLLAADQPEQARADIDRCFELASKLELPRLRTECLYWRADHGPSVAPADAERDSAEAVQLAAGIDVPMHARAWKTRLKVMWRTLPPAAAWQATRRGLDVMESLADHQSRDLESAYLLEQTQEICEWIVGRMLATNPPMLPEAFDMLERVRAHALLESVSNPSATRRDVRVVDLQALQTALQRNQALILFQVGLERDVFGDPAGGAWALAVTSERVHASRIPDRRALAARVPLLVGLLERRDGSEGAAAAALTGELLGDTLTALPPEVNELLISADGVLHSLPFPALRERAQGPALGERYTIVNVPSARLWTHWALERSDARPQRALVLADPASPTADVAAAGPSLLASLRGGAIAPLPGAREEGQWLAGELGLEAELHIGAQAREHLVKHADLASYGLLHFAAHAVADESDPDRSAVLLAPGDGDDGFLRPAEIEALALNHAVVVLSACQGASGQAVGGEGVFSLSRSFLKAGASAVIASLWPLRDDEALWFFRALYKNLEGHTPLGAALRATRRQAVQAGLPAHAWSGILLIGDGSLVPSFAAKPETR